MKKLFTLLFTVFCTLPLWAQNISVSGVVSDEAGAPVVGMIVSAKGGAMAGLTDEQGRYSADVPGDATLVFSYLGFATQEIAVGGRTRIDVAMLPDATMVDDVVVVGYGTQRRGSVTGAVASVRGSEMIKTKNENPQNMLTGKMPGVRMWQRSAEPGAYASNFDIRGYEGGGVLVVIDGIPRSMSDFQRMNSADIEDVSVLKDASAAIYGARSASGVLLVTTKKGRPGETKVSYNGSYTFQVPSSMPELANVYDAMTVYNERSKSMSNPFSQIYTETDFEAYRSGRRTETNWNDLMVANWAPQTQHDLSINGGTEKTRYYVGLGYSYQEGFFKSGDLNYNKFNVRSNISTEVANGLTFDLNLSGLMDEQHNPYSSSTDIIRRYWSMGPLLEAYADPEHTMLNYQNLDQNENSVAFMTSDVSGYRTYNKKKFMSSAELKYDFGAAFSALQGLSLKGLFSYDYEMDNNELYRKEYSLYAHNENDDTYSSFLYDKSSPSNLRREFYDKTAMLGQVVLNYEREIGKHEFGGLVGWEVQTDKADNFYALRELDFSSPYLMMGMTENQIGAMNSGNNEFHEYAYEGLLGKLNYNYDDRYLLEAQFRYDGSSKLAPGYQWHFFPSVSLGWRVSEEPFLKNWDWAARNVNQLKLRASYGRLGNDNTDYAWLSAYTYPLGTPAGNGNYNSYSPGQVVNGIFLNGVGVDALANESITWATSNTFDIGVEMTLWDGKLGATFDYFDRRRSGIYQRSGANLPTVIGAGAPMLNANSDRQFGMELELSHRNTIGEFQYRVKAMASITRRMFIKAIQNANYSNSYRKWRDDNLNNRYQGVQFGYGDAGRFTSWEDIWDYTIQHGGNTLPGDYKYEDWNGDGQINGLDTHPYAFDQTPWLNFSFSLEGSWRRLDASLLFQGSAMGSMNYLEPLRDVWGMNGGGVLGLFLDRWHTADPSADPWNPATEWISGNKSMNGGGRLPFENSAFNRVSTAYLRLKSIEIGYTLPSIKALNTMSLRVYANAYNLFTITGLEYVDPEHPDENLGRLYPLNRTFTLGLSLGF